MTGSNVESTIERPSTSDGVHPASITPDDGSEESYIFAAIRYDPILMHSPENTAASFNRPSPFYLLEHQWTRLQVANWCTSFYRKGEQSGSIGGRPTNFLHGLLCAVKHWQEIHPKEQYESLRIKVRSYISGRVTTEIWPMARIPINQLYVPSFKSPDQLEAGWAVVMDVEPTEATESTMYKTSDRFPYGRARAMAGIPTFTTPKEVLLYNTENEILDGSIATPYFYRDGRWVTPTSASGGLQGTTRRWALENALAIEGIVRKDTMQVGEKIWFSNAVRGFYHGTFELREPECGPLNVQECRRIERAMQN